MHGLEFARDHPDQATDIVMQFAAQEDRAAASTDRFLQATTKDGHVIWP